MYFVLKRDDPLKLLLLKTDVVLSQRALDALIQALLLNAVQSVHKAVRLLLLLAVSLF